MNTKLKQKGKKGRGEKIKEIRLPLPSWISDEDVFGLKEQIILAVAEIVLKHYATPRKK